MPRLLQCGGACGSRRHYGTVRYCTTDNPLRVAELPCRAAIPSCFPRAQVLRRPQHTRWSEGTSPGAPACPSTRAAEVRPTWHGMAWPHVAWHDPIWRSQAHQPLQPRQGLGLTQHLVTHNDLHTKLALPLHLKHASPRPPPAQHPGASPGQHAPSPLPCAMHALERRCPRPLPPATVARVHPVPHYGTMPCGRKPHAHCPSTALGLGTGPRNHRIARLLLHNDHQPPCSATQSAGAARVRANY